MLLKKPRGITMDKITVQLSEAGTTRTYTKEFTDSPTVIDVFEAYLEAYESFTYMNDIDVTVYNSFLGNSYVSWTREGGIEVDNAKPLDEQMSKEEGSKEEGKGEPKWGCQEEKLDNLLVQIANEMPLHLVMEFHDYDLDSPEYILKLVRMLIKENKELAETNHEMASHLYPLSYAYNLS